MKRTTIFAEAETLEFIRQIARERGISLAEAIRQALGRFVGCQKEGKKRLSILGIGRSGQKDIAERSEELLWQDYESRRRKASGER